MENGSRPTAVGMAVCGNEEKGERGAVIHMIESAKRYGCEPDAYLKDVLERLLGGTPANSTPCCLRIVRQQANRGLAANRGKCQLVSGEPQGAPTTSSDPRA